MLARTGCPYGLFSYERVQSQFCKALVFGLTAWVLSEDWCAEDSYSVLCGCAARRGSVRAPCSLCCAVLCCRLPVLPSHFPPLSLCFPSALLRVILLKTCLLPDGFVFADTMPEAHEWRTARIFFFFFFSMNTDPKIQQGGHAGSSEMSVSPSGAHSGRGRQPVTFFPCSVRS